jgi:D-beta-D-heptose 7-phosphate kinase/D-beta-D-heptose 1-phosphate adenosyltransferase
VPPSPAILVVGDALTDIYWLGAANRLSPEAPIPVVTIDDVVTLPGGAGNVAANLTALGATTTLVAGADLPEKHRLMVGDAQIARWDTHDWTTPLVEQDFSGLNPASFAGIVVADYAKGALSRPIIDFLTAWHLPMFVDTKQNPRIYPEEATFFPNRREFAAFSAYNELPKVIRKLGPDGIEMLQDGRVVATAPARAKFIRSVNGAGDTVLAAYAFAALSGLPAPLEFAMTAAAIAVESPMTTAVGFGEIFCRNDRE